MCIREFPNPERHHYQIRLVTNTSLKKLINRCEMTAPDQSPVMSDIFSELERLRENSNVISMVRNLIIIIIRTLFIEGDT